MKNKEGFTLIELLAVIVILGLLMAIAIPSVTRYITQSRKKTVATTIGNYMGALVNEVNDLQYSFTGSNTIYAVPIECISLERGGKSPFGEWMQANDDYFAYVLVQYDDDNSSYTYGFTFKDNAGYGLYPLTQNNLNEKGSQIKTGLELTRPKSDDITSLTTLEKWEESGFVVDASTGFVVLEATSEGEKGDGVTTCTLQQKGSNYKEVEEEKEKEALKDYTLMATTRYSTEAFWGYREQIKNITFQDSINIPSSVTEEHKWDVSSTGNGKVMAYITTNSSNSAYYDLYIQGAGELYANPDSSYLFEDFKYVDSINNIEELDTSNVTNMHCMFSRTGYYSLVFKLDLGNNFDTSNVTDMKGMFQLAGHSSPVFTLNLGDKFDTSNVTDMYTMFFETGYSSTVFTLDLGDKFDTSNVTDMYGMFGDAGSSSKIFTLDLGEKFDTSNVTNMRIMFQATGYTSPVFTLDLGDKFDTRNVIDMGYMFFETGYSSPVFTLDLGDKFDTSNVTDMEAMFYGTGYLSEVFTLTLGDKFDTKNVTNMYAMFAGAGCTSPIFTLDLGNNFDTSNITDMTGMFQQIGYSSPTFTLDLGDKFDTSNVTAMYAMFFETGMSSKVFTLDLGDKFDTRNVTDMSYMFYKAGYKSSLFKLDCSGWNVGKVTSHSYFNNLVKSKVTPPNWVN